jgi:hypothetical protein
MNLYIYNSAIALQGIVDVYTSLQWQRYFYQSGEFELVAPLTDDNLTLLKRSNILWPQGYPEAGVIRYRNLKLNKDTGKEEIDCKGYFLTGYLKRRIVWDDLDLSGTAESVMRSLVTKNAISPTITDRAIPLLSLGTSRGFTDTGTYQTPDDSRDNLEDALETLSMAADLGHRILFDPDSKALTFDVWRGTDRAVSQSANAPAVFCKEFGNVLEQEYTDSDDDYKNAALVGGTFTQQKTTTTTDDDGNTTTETSDEESAVLTSTGTATGLDRYEEYLASSSSSKVDSGTTDDDGNEVYTYLTETEFLAKLVTAGKISLAAYPLTKTFDATVSPKANVVYKADWDLGDKVTFISKRWGLTMDTRITGVKETYEGDDVSLDLTVGNDVPTLLTKIKKAVR